ncbi:hypothetical protein [Pandoraea apista]|uniref:hypothetical protein n=1 Tax=Pandoraea apista TaxID=93218 RepID=UPI00117EBEAF|nr:hypothetical protein [Pandoraea apista]
MAGVLGTVAGVFLISTAGATSLGLKPYDADRMASWVQAIGSIAAIGGAIWIAGDQHRRDVERRKDEQTRASYLLAAELAWVSSDIMDFLNQYADFSADRFFSVIISDDDVSDMLGRLAWCRQRIDHKGQLAMIGVLRRSLISTVRTVRRGRVMFSQTDVDALTKLRFEALGAFNAATGGTVAPQYMA